MMALLVETPKPARHHDDAVLLARAASGDDGAFATIYEAHRRPLYRLAYGVLLDQGDARDAVQEGFLRLHQAAASWEPRAAVGTWLHRVVLNHCLGVRGRLRRFVRDTFERDREREAPPADDPENKVLLDDVTRIIERSLGAMPAKQRAVVVLHLESELAPSDIATLVEMTPNATRVTLHRGLTKLREDLAKEGAVIDADAS